MPLHPFNGRRPCHVLLALAACCLSLPSQAQVVAAAGLADLTLQQLSELPVTSVSGRPESLLTAPGSVFVISGEDIRRSAATNLPEALRLAPNLQVARLNAGQYAISARGMNNAIANKLLVLVDGRTIYSTLFSGVFWDYHALPLEDIDRIEVISGPGGTLWGANAVNGIINVITKSAAATQGTLLSATRSSHGGQEVARYGGRLGEDGYYRVYGLSIDRDNTRRADNVERPDAAHKNQAGFRADQAIGPAQLTVQGDFFHGGNGGVANNLAPNMHGGNLLARWESRFADGSPYKVQAYYDLQARDETTTFRDRADSVDLQFTHEPVMPRDQQLMWGAGYRQGRDRNDPSALVLFMPTERTLTWANVFAQYQRRVGRWQWTAGLKLERNTYTGIEPLPSLRLAYEHDQATTWAALSRVVRAPARIDRDFFLPGKPPFAIAGGPGFASERANVLELGHRANPMRNLSYSATLFRQQYQGLRGGNGGTPAQVANRINGYVEGVEAWAQWQPMEWTRYTVGYLGLHKNLHFTSAPVNPTSISDLGDDPHGQWSLRAQFDLPHRTEFDIQVRHVGTLPSPLVPAYTVADARFGWQVSPRVELSLLAQNLFDRRHAEFNAPATASVFGRQVFLRVVFQL
jgi:iron complex outermembrane receptor protein